MRSSLLTLIASLALVAGATTSLAAPVPYEDTWIFRSPVIPGQSMWGPGTHQSYNFSDKYEYKLGIFKAGFEWNLQADQGTAFGNVEGNITAQYDKIVNTLGKTPVTLTYAGIDDESQIGTRFGAELSAGPYIGLDFPWPIPDVNYNLAIKMVDIDTDAKEDFTTGLDQTTSTSGRYDVLPFNADVGIVSGDINIFLDNDISFTPETIIGIMKYTHLDTLTVRQIPVAFHTDADVLALEPNLDLPGAWEFSLEEFKVSDNTFTQELDIGVEFAVGVPILSFSLSLEVDSIFDFGERQFPLEFLTHGHDGDVNTVDRLGRWCVFVVPEPGALWLLGSGFICLLGRMRRRRAFS